MNNKWKFERKTDDKKSKVGRRGIRGLIEVSSENDGKVLVLAPKNATKGSDVELKEKNETDGM